MNILVILYKASAWGPGAGGRGEVRVGLSNRHD